MSAAINDCLANDWVEADSCKLIQHGRKRPVDRVHHAEKRGLDLLNLGLGQKPAVGCNLVQIERQALDP